jgi:hypothetical protein
MTHRVQSGTRSPIGSDPAQLSPLGPALAADEGPLDRKRLFTAFTLTPLLAGFYPAIFLAEPSVMPIGLVLAYASAAAFGIPLVLFFFVRRAVRDWWQYAIGGAICALPAVILYALVKTPDHLMPFGVVPGIEVLLWGGSSGLVFWMLGIAGDSPVSLRSLFDPAPPKL